MGFLYVEPISPRSTSSCFRFRRSGTATARPRRLENGTPPIAFSDPMTRTNWRPPGDLRRHIVVAIARRFHQRHQRVQHAKQRDAYRLRRAFDHRWSTARRGRHRTPGQRHPHRAQKGIRVRFRRTVLLHYEDFPAALMGAITNRLKVMCSRHHRPSQGGRFYFEHGETQLDLRASFYVTVYGEKIVLRLLNRQGVLIHLEDVGLAPRMLERFKEDALYLPSGVILVTGPTGSGKTTTLYSCINHINDPQTSIITAEEPVEYVIDVISQCSITPRIQLTYEETLRHIVRQDPDVIVIGEIRDTFSAEIAVQAALTGHKVLTTFHTEDSIGGLIRLLNMNIEAFLISSTVVSVMAQRLLRRVCPDCAVTYRPTPLDLQRLGYGYADMHGANFQRGQGCSRCQYTGYRGRVGVFELLILNEEIRNAMIEHKTSQEIRRISIEATGLVTSWRTASSRPPPEPPPSLSCCGVCRGCRSRDRFLNWKRLLEV
jgi:type II secretory ATPase GspE/PulE/Tfp pilus assembly ATPase PilB-like protein